VIDSFATHHPSLIAPLKASLISLREGQGTMAKSAVIRVAGKADRASRLSTAAVIDALRESVPGTEFQDYAEGSARGKHPPDASALLGLVARGRADIAVLEAGELPLQFSAKLEIGAVLKRGNPFNVIISNEDHILDDFPSGITIAVSGEAISGQLLSYRDDIELVESGEGIDGLRAMLKRGEIGAFVARAWEVELLGRQDEVTEVFTSSICMPPAGQGAVALLVRAGDRKASNAARSLNHPASLSEVMLERMLLGAVSSDGRGGIGVLAEFDDGEFLLSAAITSPDGLTRVVSEERGWPGDELKVVRTLAGDLFERGGGEIIEMYRNNTED
jgi:hydroxymethylbilane synthase